MPARPPGGGATRPRLFERRETLAPEPASPGRARTVVREVLEQTGRGDWRDAAELAVTEVVTNAALHAHTPVDLHVAVFADEVCVEVRDYNPALPVPRDYGDEATTGRGMSLVAAVARSCGVESLGPDGKVVWFCVGAPEQRQSDEDVAALLSVWDVDSDGDWDASPAGAVEVVLEAMPATLWLAARQHHDAILRELVFHLAEHEVPGVDVDFVAADAARSVISNAVLAAVDEARARGTARPAVPGGHPSPLPWVPDRLDLRLQVPVESAADYSALQDALDVAEALAVEGRLLARPGLPEIVAVRDWACEQVIAQCSGSPRAPWPGTSQERFETAVRDRSVPAVPEWDADVVIEASSPVIAADDANRIVAVSRPLAELLGWEVDDLVGRRVVTVIPPALREAHVAGFSRHLSTGEAHVIGVPIELPVLRKDGTEVACRFLIEVAPAQPQRRVYVAWLDPVEVEVAASEASRG